jgi:hypothetical protein
MIRSRSFEAQFGQRASGRGPALRKRPVKPQTVQVRAGLRLKCCSGSLASRAHTALRTPKAGAARRIDSRQRAGFSPRGWPLMSRLPCCDGRLRPRAIDPRVLRSQQLRTMRFRWQFRNQGGPLFVLSPLRRLSLSRLNQRDDIADSQADRQRQPPSPPVYLHCSRDENVRRLTNADRALRGKITSEQGLDSFLAHYRISAVPRADCLVLDTSVRAAEMTAQEIVRHYALA